MKSCFSTYLDNIEIDADVNVCIRVLQETEAIRRLCVCVCVCVCACSCAPLYSLLFEFGSRDHRGFRSEDQHLASWTPDCC